MIASRKNPPAYQVRRSAVKKTQNEKRGIAKNRDKIPAHAANLGLLLKIRNTNRAKNIMSCTFISF